MPPPSSASSSRPTTQSQAVQHTVTPWRYPSDLLHVRNKLYTPTTPEEQAQAIATVAAWKLRGNVPHAVESTALLFDAMLFHARTMSSSTTTAAPSDPEGGIGSISSMTVSSPTSFALRAAYTTALSRFVTGFADLGRHRSGIGQSMFDVARTIALPMHFVELRHEVAHEEMPGLARLVRSAREAGQWLWGVYWARLEEGDGVDSSSSATLMKEHAEVLPPSLPAGAIRERSRAALREFKSQRLAKLKAGRGKKDGKAQAAITSRECANLCQGEESRERWDEVARVLVDEGLIIPVLKKRGPLSDTALQGAYLLWDELLLELRLSSETFMEVFLERAVSYIAAFTNFDDDDDRSDPGKWTIYRWVMHILYSERWVQSRASTAADWESLTLLECSLYPGVKWVQNLTSDVEEAAKAAKDDVTSPASGSLDDASSSKTSTRDGKKMNSDFADAPAQKRRRWRQDDLWEPIPIGVV
ncbi:hypothetical protein AAFC00_003217 [Neodothiora populina]|uniref:Las1-domain-containing protein n=1 Tax=Neodothiora populina TaxID=2781224 RepID=A0ABR3PAW1_9PEZI